MIVKYYGLYDTKAKEFINLFTSRNDEVAERSAKYIVRDDKFDPIAGRDYCIQHVFDIDVSTGIITDNSISVICTLGTYYDEYLVELNQKKEEGVK